MTAIEGQASMRCGDRRARLMQALCDALGEAHVACDRDTLGRYAHSTSSRSTRALAVVRPDSSAEVAAVLGVASRFGVPVYPISTGRNWGYGDACPVGEGQLIIDLGRMNRILEVDPELAYAVIEPGVTQQQLSDYLREQGLPLWADCTGAGPDTSFVGNIVERGFGHSPYGNRLQHVSGMEVVLANGEVLETGFGHYAQARSRHVFPYGVGPFLDGMFTQSNFGIVTRLGLWLMPAAQCIEHFICTVDEHERIVDVVDALRPLRLDGTLRSTVHIGNDLRVLSGGMVSPGLMTATLRNSLRAAAGVGAWTVSGALYGSKRQVAAARHALRSALRGTGARTSILTEGKLRAGAVLARVLGNSAAGQRLQSRVDLGNALFAMNRGVPHGRFLSGAYWRRRGGLPEHFPRQANPAHDNCGMMWVSPVLPMRGSELHALMALVEPVFEEYSFDLFATFSMINERALGGVLTIAYDKDDAIETARARRCYHALFGLVMAAGYIPYRVGNQSMGELDPEHDVYWRTVARIKTALDPDGLIAPGRYQPASAIFTAGPGGL
jgi:4-cresol dehydrogenase (hydroxylating)